MENRGKIYHTLNRAMNKVMHLVIFISWITACGQSKNSTIKAESNEDSLKYAQASLEFFQQIVGLESNDTAFILVDKPFTYDYFHCSETLKADTSNLSKEAVVAIKKRQLDSSFRWSYQYFPKIKIVQNNVIDSFFNSGVMLGWTSFKQKIGPRFHYFSIPIFLRDYTYCFFYSDTHCGPLCGGGRMTLYKKVNNRWVEIKSYCKWIS